MMPTQYASRLPNVQIPRQREGSIGSGMGAFLAPPLYYNSKEALGRRHKESRVLIVTDKQGNRVNLLGSPSSFTPIKDEKPSCPFTTGSAPPKSPYHYSTMVPSPAPTLMSATSSSETAETSISSPYCMSPSPTNYSCHPVSAYTNRYNEFYCSTPSSRYTRHPMRSPEDYVTPTRRSPTKRTSITSQGITTPSSNTDDTSRKQRVKTELCAHHESGKICPFGAKCMYAHGEEELQMTKLMDWHRAGLIEDIETFRAKPCLTWVTTGSCPFGKRCACIHDPRVAGTNPSWLPHTETQGNSISTDINVDGMHQKRLHSILYGNPFGDQFSFELDDWVDLYKLICNFTPNTRRRRTSNMTELQKLSIVLQMRGNPGWMYKYRPQHIIYETLCMVVQKRAFRVEKSGAAIEIKLYQFNPNNPKHILVREIAFGPDSDPSVRPVSLWFNIPESAVSECTPQQAKRFRWKKKPKGEEQQAPTKGVQFDSQDSFVMVRPGDRDAFVLATNILKYRYQTLKADGLTNMRDRSVALKAAEQEKSRLQEEFKGHRRHWLEWAWPVNRGRHQTVNEDTPVPLVEVDYTPIIDEESLCPRVNMHEAIQGHFVQRIWDSFVSYTLAEGEGSANQGISIDQQACPESSRRRLPVFALLGYGQHISTNRTLPHIRNSQGRREMKVSGSERQSERCWKALMLKENTDLKDTNEWEIVREHFQNARCKKVLTIIQQ